MGGLIITTAIITTVIILGIFYAGIMTFILMNNKDRGKK